MTAAAMDAELVARLQAGDSGAFEALVRRESGPLLRAARRFLRSEEDARDAVQDAFISAYKSIGSFAANSRLSTWLHRILINAALMRLRTQKRRPEEDIEAYLPRFAEDGHQLEPSVPWTEPAADDFLERAETRDLVRSAIERLPEQYRIVLVLRDIEEMTTEETAEALGITPNAVKIRLHRGRQALRTLLDPHMRGTNR